jgi:hypothetical protein
MAHVRVVDLEPHPVEQLVFSAELFRRLSSRRDVGPRGLLFTDPEFFGGAKRDPASGVRLASPEKALVDVLYLEPARSRLFASLPELELPSGFDWRGARGWVAHIPSQRTRGLVRRRLDTYEAGAREGEALSP